MQNYKIAMDYLKTIIGIVVGGLVIWSQIAESRAKQRRKAEAAKRSQPVPFDADWSTSTDDYEPLSHNHFQPVNAEPIDTKVEEGQRVTSDMPPVPVATKAKTDDASASSESADIERWRRAIIDSEILKTKF